MLRFEITLKQKTTCLENLPNDFKELVRNLSAQTKLEEHFLPQYFVISYVDDEGDNIIIENQDDYEVFCQDQTISQLCLNLDEVSSEEEGHHSRDRIFQHEQEEENLQKEPSPIQADFKQQLKTELEGHFQKLLETININIKESIAENLRPKPKNIVQNPQLPGEIRNLMEPLLIRLEKLEQTMLNAQGIKEFLHASKTFQHVYNEQFNALKDHIDALSTRNCENRKRQQKMKREKSSLGQAIKKYRRAVKANNVE